MYSAKLTWALQPTKVSWAFCGGFLGEKVPNFTGFWGFRSRDFGRFFLQPLVCARIRPMTLQVKPEPGKVNRKPNM